MSDYFQSNFYNRILIVNVKNGNTNTKRLTNRGYTSLVQAICELFIVIAAVIRLISNIREMYFSMNYIVKK